MPYFLLHLNNKCHFQCFRVHIYNTFQENILLASMSGIMQVYSVDIFSSFDVLCSRWFSVVRVWCTSWKHYLFILLQNSLQTTWECGLILQGTIQKHHWRVFLPQGTSSFTITHLESMMFSLVDKGKEARTIFLWRSVLCLSFFIFCPV